jgi:alkylation response protein AidB-like acyl-CoA dehydrogenase
MGDADAIVTAAQALGAKIRAAGDEIEQARRLPLHIVEELRRIGAFRMPMPREWGGPELDPLAQVRVIEALSQADGSVGWCVMIGSDGGFFTAFLDQAVAREMYPDLDAATGGSLVFSGRAETAKDGYRVTGKWPFVSGCQHCQWIVTSCLVFENGAPRKLANGMPEARVCFMPASRGAVLDTWTTTGLRGSGSHDFSANDVFVPREQSFSFQDLTIRRPRPLYAYPWMFVCNLPGVALGIARGALDVFVELARTRRTTVPGASGARVLLRDEAYVQSVAGHAEALVGSARSYVFDTLGDTWATLVKGDEPSMQQRARLRLAMTHTHSACVQAVDLLYKAAGGMAVYAANPFDRPFRDLHTINQHTFTSLRTYESVGRVLLGLDSREILF